MSAPFSLPDDFPPRLVEVEPGVAVNLDHVAVMTLGQQLDSAYWNLKLLMGVDRVITLWEKDFDEQAEARALYDLLLSLSAL